MSQNESGIYLKKGQSVDSEVIQQAQQDPDRMLAYLETLPDDMQHFVHESDNLIGHLYKVALESRSMRANQSA